jgi:hypothetical protein
MSTQYKSTRGIYEWRFVGQLALHDHGQLRPHALGASEVKPDPIVFASPVHHILLTYNSPPVRPTEVRSAFRFKRQVLLAGAAPVHEHVVLTLPKSRQQLLVSLNSYVKGGALGVQELNSATKLIQRHQGGSPMQPMYYIGLDVHKRAISYCVKDGSGAIHAEGTLTATRLDLDRWMRTLPQPWTAAMEATVFTGWIYDHLQPHAAA